MQRNASALPFLLALAITRAHGEALFTDPVATNSANAPLIWLNRETTGATTLTLTREPDGGDTIAVIPRGGSITALMRDADGHTLAKTPFGITGWAQAQAGEDSGETFPALALRHDDTLNIDLYYHPQLGKPQNNHYYYNEAEPDTPSPGLPPDPAADEPAPHYTTYDRLLETALKADGARYHIDCSAGASGDYHCLFLNAAQGKIRRTNVAGLPGQTFYIPGNGAIYSDTDDSNSRYYRVRQKWTLHNGEIQENEQPYHYLGLASQYRGILKADSGAHDRKTPLRLLERIGGKKTVAKIAAGEPLRILLADPNQPCAKDAQLGDSDLCADLWLLIQNKDGKTGWAKINYQRDTPDLEGLHPLAE